MMFSRHPRFSPQPPPSGFVYPYCMHCGFRFFDRAVVPEHSPEKHQTCNACRRAPVDTAEEDRLFLEVLDTGVKPPTTQE